jgi:hypothetical protein
MDIRRCAFGWLSYLPPELTAQYEFAVEIG